MTIEEVISLMNITDVPFIPQMYGNNEEGVLPVYSTKQGVCYYRNESIWSIGIREQCKNQIYEIKNKLCEIEKKLYCNEREIDKYVAVFIILYAVANYKGENSSICFENIRNYVEILNNAIYEALGFQQISDMDTLKEIISSDTLYCEMLFNVNEVHSTKDREYTGYKKDTKSYCFGNVRYHEDLDKVFIRTYDDHVELVCAKEGRSHEQKLDIRKSYTSEGKILAALDCWRCDFLN